MKLEGKTAIITGAAIRLGRAITMELAEHGVNIFGVYYSSQEDAQHLEREMNVDGHRLFLYQADVTKKDDRQKIVEACLQNYKSIDILVNNSAIFYPTPLDEATEEDWDKFHDLNLKSAFFLAKDVGLLMKKQGNGRIVNIGDTSFSKPWPDYIPYTLTKAGVNSMTAGLAKALAPNVLVNCINPGPVLLPDDYSEKQREKAVKNTLLKRTGTAEDVAKTVRFLCETDYITGAAIPVDGGRHIA